MQMALSSVCFRVRWDRKSMNPSNRQTRLCASPRRLGYRKCRLVLDTSFVIRVSYLVSTGYICQKASAKVTSLAQFVMDFLAELIRPISESIIREWRYESSAWCRSGTIIKFFMSASTGREVAGNARFQQRHTIDIPFDVC